MLVEGLSDRIFFEAVLDHHGRSSSSTSIIEVISVGGKGFFRAYEKVLIACKIKYSIIADLDYVEEIGTPDIKALFKTNTQEIKKDIVENPKSIDGDTIVWAIEQALRDGNWNNAKEIWNYIKKRRKQLKEIISSDENYVLKTFLDAKKADRVFILSLGTLESYLPAGCRSKDLDKLIRLISRNDFWEQLPSNGRGELEFIAYSLLPSLHLGNIERSSDINS